MLAIEKVNSTLLGAAAEHFVMSQLLRRNLIAALAPTGAPNADIIVSDQHCQRVASIQVKARRDIGSDGGWHMKTKHETQRSELLFFCLVDFGKSADIAKTWVVPSAVVADAVQLSHQTWLAMPGKRGQEHKDSDIRRLLPSYEKLGLSQYKLGWLVQYSEAWHLIEARTEG